ncbi:DinB family protein [Mucilaginibacter glaciei]|uniref:DinB family protein n=1 Tax=Mucilaginibacter glaciei TaxID=2772109 RepID=A0A926S0P3_9SPHI|nr:DinB family protein [Mucilaginibacter glaciei]MBD1392198.1 DinB family protein [Mucilaginibacter glaciei]
MIWIAQQINQEVANFLSQTSPRIMWDNNTVADKWNNKEILGHLIDSAHVNLTRFIRCTYEDCFKLTYHQDEWVKAQHYREADVAELLQLWQLVNRQIARVLEDFPAERLTATCDNGHRNVTFYTVEYLANDYLAHMQHHLLQIAGVD